MKTEENPIKSEHSTDPTGQFKCFKCKNCEFISLSQSRIDGHACELYKENKYHCCGCNNVFWNKNTLKMHLLEDHKVQKDELEVFIKHICKTKPKQKIYIKNVQLLKKPDLIEVPKNKSKIFIKDVQLLRKPDLPQNDLPIPNIFDSLDLTNGSQTDFFQNFLEDMGQDFEDDFDFDDSAQVINSFNDNQYTTIQNCDTPTNKIYVRSVDSLSDSRQELSAPEFPASPKNNSELNSTKIYVKDVHSLLNIPQENQDVVQSMENDLSTGNVSEVQANKIFMRSVDSLTENPPVIDIINDYIEDIQYYPMEDITVSSEKTKSKIFIKNIRVLIEPNLIQPHLLNSSSNMIYDQSQLLSVNSVPVEEVSLVNVRDENFTPETLPDSSNVSNYGNNEESELPENMMMMYTNVDFSENQNQYDGLMLAAENTDHLQDIFNTINKLGAGEFTDNILQNDDFIMPVETSFQVPTENQSENGTPTIENKVSDLLINQSNEINHNDSHNHAKNEEKPMVRISTDLIKDLEKGDKSNGTTIKLKKKLQCKLNHCNYQFSTDLLLSYHSNCHTNLSNNIICPECKSLDFKNFTSLHTHLWRQHQIDMDLYSCSQCSFKTPILSRLNNFHLKIHSESKDFSCNKCDKSFKNSKQLKNHRRLHILNEEKQKIEISCKKLSCLECKKVFTSESGLYIHSMEHKNNEKKFKCEFCNYSTNDHNSFRRHNSKHSSIHKYSCPACQYSSIQSTTYRVS